MKHVIPGDYQRCANYECSQRFQCKRAIQLDLDKTNADSRAYSQMRFDSKDCQNIIL